MTINTYAVGNCHDCGKRCFLSRKATKGYIRRFFPGHSFTVYRCGEYWHFGHVSYEVSRGTKQRASA
jgi:hypothetical protein